MEKLLENEFSKDIVSVFNYFQINPPNFDELNEQTTNHMEHNNTTINSIISVRSTKAQSPSAIEQLVRKKCCHFILIFTN